MAGRGEDEDNVQAKLDIRLEADVALPDLKFSAAHFVAFRGFREPVHGHNYTAGVRASGGSVQADGYIIDFGDLKQALRKECKRLNSRVLIPANSDVLQIRQVEAAEGESAQLDIVCEDGSNIRLPLQDCAILPIVHTTAEEIAEFLWLRLCVDSGLGEVLVSRGIDSVEVSVHERPGQGARYSRPISDDVLRAHRVLTKEGNNISSSSHGGQRGDSAVAALRQTSRPPRPCLMADELVASPPLLPAALSSGDTVERQPRSRETAARGRFRLSSPRGAKFCTGSCVCCSNVVAQGVAAATDKTAGGQHVTPAAAAVPMSVATRTGAAPLMQAAPDVSSQARMPSDSGSASRDPRAVAEAAFRSLIQTLGDREAGRPELLKTPARAAKAWLELTSGIAEEDPLRAVGEGIFEVEGAQDLVAVREIQFNSLCEHHLLPFWGTAHVAYIPDGRVLGLSKFARLLKVFSRRLQLQERLTYQFAEALDELLAPHAVLVSMEARHACMSMRGVATPAVTRTIAFRGPCKDDQVTRDTLLTGIGSDAARAKL